MSDEMFLKQSEIIDQLTAEVKRLEGLVYVNGLFKCAKCGFVMSCRNLNMSAGTITSNDTPQQCNNGCGPMWRVDAKTDREEVIASVEGIIVPLREQRDAAVARAEAMREALKPLLSRDPMKVHGPCDPFVRVSTDELAAIRRAARVVEEG